MILRDYNCLIAGLPDIFIGDNKIPATPADFRNYLSDELLPEHYKLVQLLFLPFDNINITNAIFKTGKTFDNRGNYPASVIEKLIDKKEHESGEIFNLPNYIINTVNKTLFADTPVTFLQTELELTIGYYNLLLSTNNAFIKKYCQYQQLVRNIFVALNGRKHNIDVDNSFIGQNDIINALKKNRSRDFGLTTEVDNIEKLIQIFETPDIVDREIKLDNLTWNYIDDITFFNYFTIEKILVFVIKLLIVERWYNLDEEKGKALFDKMLNDIENSYEFPEEFKLKHGKNK